jgi:hypothetical protein
MSPEGAPNDQLLKNYILSQDIKTQRQSPKSGVVMSRGDVPLCHEISGASEFVEWTSEEAHIIFHKLLNWWNADKEFLDQYKSGDVRNEFELRFKRLRMALIKAVPRNFNSELEKDVVALQNLVKEMSQYGLAVCSIKCSFSHIVPSWKDELATMISTSYLDTEKAIIEDTIEGMYLLFDGVCEGVDEALIRHCLELLGSSLLVRDKHRLTFSLIACFRIVSNYKQHFGKPFEYAVLFALDKLKSETDGPNNLFSLHEGLYLREVAAQLAHLLYRYYIDMNIEVPEVINDWRTICENHDEFVEIRNSWVLSE